MRPTVSTSQRCAYHTRDALAFPQPNDPQSLPLNLNSDKSAPLPLPSLQTCTSIWDIPRHTHEQSNRVLSSSLDIAARGVHNDNTQPRSGWNVDIINADTGSRDDLQVASSVEQLSRDFCFGAHQESVVLWYDVDEFFW
jgi:hypothetical protein